jgi:hypothetical protein
LRQKAPIQGSSTPNSAIRLRLPQDHVPPLEKMLPFRQNVPDRRLHPKHHSVCCTGAGPL